jgi:hypothetical protein
MMEVIALHFSGALDAADVDDLSVFGLKTIPKKKRPSTPVALAGASYNPTKFALILTPGQRLVLNPPIRLTVFAAEPLDAQGRPLDGGDNFGALLSATGVRFASAVQGRS